ncbi:uncharacterized protein LOC111631173 [Centruroides sculpturatus]|uniref:uncharacterized protein LOC111631173 n=1 Tax=Centruroides sculpturatus TaxID=218467 RepID=UPI000C6E2FA9|nr:uncharacterized protein LOC111631173 [Centruroides sculpturatus]
MSQKHFNEFKDYVKRHIPSNEKRKALREITLNAVNYADLSRSLRSRKGSEIVIKKEPDCDNYITSGNGIECKTRDDKPEIVYCGTFKTEDVRHNFVTVEVEQRNLDLVEDDEYNFVTVEEEQHKLSIEDERYNFVEVEDDVREMGIVDNICNSFSVANEDDKIIRVDDNNRIEHEKYSLVRNKKDISGCGIQSYNSNCCHQDDFKKYRVPSSLIRPEFDCFKNTVGRKSKNKDKENIRCIKEKNIDTDFGEGSSKQDFMMRLNI